MINVTRRQALFTMGTAVLASRAGAAATAILPGRRPAVDGVAAFLRAVEAGDLGEVNWMRFGRDS
jgi:hypothetical protein